MSQLKLLLIDDDDALRSTLVRMLECIDGIDVTAAGSAEEGAAIVADGGFDFVLVDYKMPVHDGLWFMENADIPKSTKVLLMTAFVNRDVINAMFASGISGYLVKPFTEEELMRHLHFHSVATPDAGGL